MRWLRLEVPWGLPIGLVRTLIALACAVTLLATPPTILFANLLTSERSALCTGLKDLSLFCLVPPSEISTTQYTAAGLLIVIGTGVLPAVTSLPLAYLIVSFAWSCSLPDGGEQVATALVLLTLPVCLTDPRRWHFSEAVTTEGTQPGALRTATAAVFFTLARFQVAVIYLDACLGKLGTSAWQEGSALYYWVRHPNFGPPHWLAAPLLGLTAVPVVVLALSWGTLVLEFALALSPLLPMMVRVRLLLPAGFIFHLAIAMVLGITSFAVVMLGALALLLIPPSLTVVSRPSAPHAARPEKEIRHEHPSYLDPVP